MIQAIVISPIKIEVGARPDEDGLVGVRTSRAIVLYFYHQHATTPSAKRLRLVNFTGNGKNIA